MSPACDATVEEVGGTSAAARVELYHARRRRCRPRRHGTLVGLAWSERALAELSLLDACPAGWIPFAIPLAGVSPAAFRLSIAALPAATALSIVGFIDPTGGASRLVSVVAAAAAESLACVSLPPQAARNAAA